MDKLDLLDNRLMAVHKTGPHYTRQATYGPRFNQSRIDRSYSSNRGSWVEFVREVIHDATQSLSDHHPSLVRIALLPFEQNGQRKSSYMKLDALELSVESTNIALKLAWDEQMIDGRDPCINWELGWKAICKEIKKISKARAETEKNQPNLDEQLYELRLAICLDQNLDLCQRIKEIEEIKETKEINEIKEIYTSSVFVVGPRG